MKRQQLFPRCLLEKDDATKKQFFEEYLVRHPTMDEVLKRLRNAIEDAGRDTMIYLYGPSGVGKSTVRDQSKRS